MYFVKKAKTNPSGYWPLDSLKNAVNSGDAVLSGGTAHWHASPIYGKGGSLIVGSGGAVISIPTPIFQTGTLGEYFYLECVLYWVKGDGMVKIFGHETADGLRAFKDKIDFTIIHANKTIVLEAPTTPGDVYLARVVHTGERVSLHLNDIEYDAYEYDGTEGKMTANPANVLQVGPFTGDCQYAVSHLVVSNQPYRPVEYESVIDNELRLATEVQSTPLALGYKTSNILEWDISKQSPIYEGTPATEDDFLTADTLSYAYFNFPLEPGEGNSIFGVLLEYDSNNLVETTVNGTSWQPVTSGAFSGSILPGFNAQEQVLTIRATLEPGTEFRSLKATLVDNNNISITYRPVLISGGTVLRQRSSRLLSTKDHIALDGNLVIGEDPGLQESAISFWYKGSDITVVDQDATMYVNGVETDTLDGKWYHVVITGIELPASLNGNGVIANIMTHEALTQTQAQSLYRASTDNVIAAYTVDNIGISDNGAKGYDYEWEIVAGGR